MRVWKGTVDGETAALFRLPPGGLAFVRPGEPAADWVRPWNTVTRCSPGPWIPPALTVEFGAVNTRGEAGIEVERDGDWRWVVYAIPGSPRCLLALYLGQGMVVHTVWPATAGVRWRVGRAASVAATVLQVGGGE